MPTSCSRSEWTLVRKVAWAALLLAMMGWASVLQPPQPPEPLGLTGYLIA